MSGRNAKVIRRLARLASVSKRAAYRFWENSGETIPHMQRLYPTVKYAQQLLGHLPKLPGETLGT
jgi:hypothetical protein